MQVEVKVCRAYGARTMFGESMPRPRRAGLTLGGRPLRQAQGRLYGPQSPDCPSPKTFPGRACRTAVPSATLGMTKGGVVLSLNIAVDGENSRPLTSRRFFNAYGPPRRDGLVASASDCNQIGRLMEKTEPLPSWLTTPILPR
jgi:hypothetical protein